jgi:hypothetical protein
MEAEKDRSMVIRFAAFRVAEAMAGSKAIGNIERFWPTEASKPKDAKKFTKEEYDAIIKRHGVKIK